jgi:hypothetical protein
MKDIERLVDEAVSHKRSVDSFWHELDETSQKEFLDTFEHRLEATIAESRKGIEALEKVILEYQLMLDQIRTMRAAVNLGKEPLQ